LDLLWDFDAEAGKRCLALVVDVIDAAEGCALVVTIFVGRVVLSRGELDTHRLGGGIALYLNTSLVFAASYIRLLFATRGRPNAY
jgi:hypothetical protein